MERALFVRPGDGMEFWRAVLAPIYAALLAGLVVAVLTAGRRGPDSRVPRLPLVWFGMLAFGGFLLVSGLGNVAFVVWSSESFGRSVGIALLVAAALLAVRGTRVRSGSELLRDSAPKSLDDAVAELRAGASTSWGVFQGTLDAQEELTSPGGVGCAFYEAELREVASDGRKGTLLSRERAYSPTLTLRGARIRARVRFSPASLMAPVRPRRCRTVCLPTPSAWLEERPVAPEGASVPEARQLTDEPWALSWERAGTAGETCFVVGELRRGPREGTYELCGRGGGPALVVLGPEAQDTRGTLARRAWTHFTAAGVMSVAAALMLSRTL